MKSLVLLAAIGTAFFADQTVTFDKELPKQWSKTIGSWEVVDGALIGREVAVDDHAAASRYMVPIKDGEVRFRFRMNDAKTVSFGFDPVKGELKKKGHLYSVIVTRNQLSLKKHKDKADAKSKDVVVDSKKVELNEDEWIDVVLTLKGTVAHAKIGSHVLKGEDAEFAVAKPGVVFRVSKGSAAFDDVVVKPAG